MHDVTRVAEIDSPSPRFSSAVSSAEPGTVTAWLTRWRAGDRAAAEHVVPLVYDELRRVARRQLRRESPDHTLSPTALVHETYLRLCQQHHLHAADRDGLLAIAGCVMRRILVDHARTRTRLKRGGDARPVHLDTDDDPALLSEVDIDEVLAVDLALERLDDRARRVVECRIFAGLTLEETARVLGVSSKSVQRIWTTARAWLRMEIRPPAAGA